MKHIVTALRLTKLLFGFLFCTSAFATNDYHGCLGDLNKIGTPGYVNKLTKYNITSTSVEYSSKLYVRGGFCCDLKVVKNLSDISNQNFVVQAFQDFSNNQENANLCYRLELDGRERLELIYR